MDFLTETQRQEVLKKFSEWKENEVILILETHVTRSFPSQEDQLFISSLLHAQSQPPSLSGGCMTPGSSWVSPTRTWAPKTPLHPRMCSHLVLPTWTASILHSCGDADPQILHSYFFSLIFNLFFAKWGRKIVVCFLNNFDADPCEEAGLWWRRRHAVLLSILAYPAGPSMSLLPAS